MKQFLALIFVLSASAYAQPQIGGGTCLNSTLTGTYYYLLSGNLLSGSQPAPYVELGQLNLDEVGRVSGASRAAVNGTITSSVLRGTYTVHHSSCLGTMTLTANAQPTAPIIFQVINGGAEAAFSLSTPAGVVTGRAFRQAATPQQNQCNTATLSGSYAFLLSGMIFEPGKRVYYSQVGNIAGDGRGTLTVAGAANVGGKPDAITGQGTYSVAADCSGTLKVTNSNGTINYYIAVVEDGKRVLIMQSDSGYTIGGTAQPVFTSASNVVVNAASFDPQALAPGAIFSLFGAELPTSADSARVEVDGVPVPVFFANGTQLNGQIPYSAATDKPVSLSVIDAGKRSNEVRLALRKTAPAFFTYSGNRAVVQNADYTLNTSENPARAGDTVIAYLTGPGAVMPAAATGIKAPAVPLANVAAPYSFMIGGRPPAVSFFGLSPGFVGLYQANIVIPSLGPGDYALVASVGGESSNAPLISIR